MRLFDWTYECSHCGDIRTGKWWRIPPGWRWHYYPSDSQGSSRALLCNRDIICGKRPSRVAAEAKGEGR